MKRILILLLVFCSMTALGQKPITASITMPSQPAANTADWLTGAVPIMINAQSKLVQGQLPPQVVESRILVKIKIPGGAGICGSYTSTTAPLSNFNKANMIWSGAAVMGLLGQECTLKAGTYTLCVQFFSAYAPIQPLSEEVCKTFTIADNSQVIYTGPQNMAPANGISITQLQAKQPMQIKWISVRPPPPNNDDIMYTVHVFVVEKGQSPAQAAKTNTPVFVKEVNTTQTIWQLPRELTNSKETVTLVWNVQGTDKNGKPYGPGKGISEPTVFVISAPPSGAVIPQCNCITITDNASCHGTFNGTPAYALIDVINNTCNKTITAWSITSTSGTIMGSPAPQTLNTGINHPLATMLVNATAGPQVLDYTFTFADGTSCTMKKDISLPNCTVTACDCTPQWTPFTIEGIKYDCGAKLPWPCNKPLSFTSYYKCNGPLPACVTLTSWEIKNGTSTIKTGTGSNNISDGFTPTANGLYTITLHATCNGKVCPPCTLTIEVTNCPTTCKCSAWPGISIGPIVYKCGKNLLWSCNKPLAFSSYYKCDPNDATCKTVTSWDIKYGTTPIKTGTGGNNISDVFTPTANGTYTITLHATCNGKECEPCTLTVTVEDCKKCECSEKWGHIGINGNKYDCGDKITWPCNKPLTFSSGYQCVSAPGIPCKTVTSWEVRNNTTNTVVKTGNGSNIINDAFTPTANGIYTITMNASCNGVPCPPCTFTVVVDNCKPCTCGDWVLFVVDGKQYKCGEKFKWPCKKLLTFNGTYKCNPDDQTCSAITTWEIKNGNTPIKTGTGANGFSDAFTPTTNGNYTITLHASCNGKECEPCIITVIVDDCTGCDCGDWGFIVINDKKYDCNAEIPWKCNVPVKFSADYHCKSDMCKATIDWSVSKDGNPFKTGTGVGSVGDFFTPTVNGVYVITFTPICNGKKCKTCTITIIVKDCAKCDCGPWGPVKYVYKKGGVEQPWKSVDCGSTITAEKGYPYTFISNLSCKPPTECKPDSSIVTVYNESGHVIYTIPGQILKDFVFEKCGKYQIVFTGYCGGHLCKCVLNINVPCCECKGEPTIILTNQDGKKKEIKCGAQKYIKLECNNKYTLDATANCSGDSCKSKVLISINGPGINIVNQPAPVTFVFSQTGTYTATITPYCGADSCPPCKIVFVDTCICKTCDKKKITITETGMPIVHHSGSTSGYDLLELNYMIAASLPKITEVKVELVSFDVLLSGKLCKSPENKIEFSQGQFNQSGNTLASATDWNPANPISGSYRELQWISINAPGVDMTGGKALKLKIGIPDYYKTECCTFSYRYCLRVILRDADCVVCDRLLCFKKDAGGYQVQTSFEKPTFSDLEKSPE